MDTSEFDGKTDEELMTLCRQNGELFGMLVSRYEAKLRRYLHRITNVDNAGLDDLLQEVFMKAYVNLNGFDTTLKFSSWIYRIAHNEAVSGARRRQVRPLSATEIDAEAMERVVGDTDLVRELLQDDAKKAVGIALGKLPAKYHEVVVLRYFEDKSYEEIGDIIKKPVNTVGTILRRAKIVLKGLIKL